MILNCKLKPEDVECLDLSGLDGLTNLALTLDGKTTLGQTYPKLQQIQLTGCVHITDTAIIALATITNLTKVSPVKINVLFLRA